MLNIDPKRFTPYESAFRPDVRIGDHAYSLCGGPCAGMITIEDSEMLAELTRRCIAEKIPYRVVGGLSNLLVSDKGFDGVILLNRKGKVTHFTDADGSVVLTADSGAPAAAVVSYCVQNGLSGFEWACGLPGTVGGAVYGNAGAFGTAVADIFRSCEVLEPDGKTETLSAADMGFSYRGSSLKGGQHDRTILRASFDVERDDPEQIRQRGEANREKRHAGQPFSERSLGSVFKNPEGASAGKLIQDAGLKGMSIGKARVSEKHANFIVTAEGVRSEDYRKLIGYVQSAVSERFGVRLEPEIEFLGFED